MATKIKLGQRPATFAPITVNFKLPEGGDGCMEVTPKYFTRKEFGKLLDDLSKAKAAEFGKVVDVPAETAEFKPLSMEEMQTKQVDTQADYLVQVLHAWNLDDKELNLENLQQLSDQCPAAAAAIAAAVREAITEGRLGN